MAVLRLFIGLRFGGGGEVRSGTNINLTGLFRSATNSNLTRLRVGGGELLIGDEDGDGYLANLNRTGLPGVTDGDTFRRPFGEAGITGDDEIIRHVLSGLPVDEDNERDGLLRCGVDIIGVRIGLAGGGGDGQSWLCVWSSSDNALHCAFSLSFTGSLGLP